MTTRIIISLTTIRQRLHLLPDTLRSLLTQDPVSGANIEIYVFLSCEPYLLDTGFSNEDIDELEEKFPLVNFKVVSNTGPFRKLIPILNILRRDKLESFIITVDDDCQYEKGMVQKLLSSAILNFPSVVCGRARGVDMKNTVFEHTNVCSFPLLEPDSIEKLEAMPEGVGSVCYHSLFFNDLDTKPLSTKADILYSLSNFERKNDDVYFRKHTYKKNIKVNIVNIEYEDSMPESGLYADFNAYVGVSEEVACDDCF